MHMYTSKHQVMRGGAYMYDRACECLCFCVVCARECLYVHVYMHAHACVRLCVCACVLVCVRVCAHVSESDFRSVCASLHMSASTHVCVPCRGAQTWAFKHMPSSIKGHACPCAGAALETAIPIKLK